MDVKPGYQTTEFWITLLGNVVGIVSLFHPVSATVTSNIPMIAGILVMVATNVSYFITRSNVKVAASQASVPAVVASVAK